MAFNFNDFNNGADITDQFEKEDIENNKVMGILSYLSWLVIIPLIVVPKSKYAKFHANQGLILALVEIVWIVISRILNAILSPLHLGFVISLISIVVYLAILVLVVTGLLNAVNGKAKELPFIGSIKVLK